MKMIIPLDRRALLKGVSAAGLLILRPSLAAEAGTLIRMEVDNESWPISMRDEHGQYVGMLESTLEVINRDLGWRFELSTYPWRRTLEYVRQGALDAYCTLATAERRTYTVFSSRPLFTLDAGWAHYSLDNPRAAEIAKISSMDELRSFRIGLERGESWPNPMFADGWKTVEVEDAFLLDGMVRGGRIDLFFEVPELLSYYERTKGWPHLAKTHLTWLPGSITEYRFGLRSSYPHADRLMASFDRAHEHYEQSGDIKNAQAIFRG